MAQRNEAVVTFTLEELQRLINTVGNSNDPRLETIINKLWNAKKRIERGK